MSRSPSQKLTEEEKAQYQELWDYALKGLYTFDIDSIDGVKVSVQLRRAKDPREEKMCLCISNHFDFDDDLYVEFIDSPTQLALTFTVVLPRLRFDKYKSEFSVPKEHKRFEHLFHMHDVKKKSDMCAVCHDATLVKNRYCGHFLCLQCQSQLTKQSCPTCRSCLCCGEELTCA